MEVEPIQPSTQIEEEEEINDSTKNKDWHKIFRVSVKKEKKW